MTGSGGRRLALVGLLLCTLPLVGCPGPFNAGSAVLYDTGESYYQRHQDIPGYYAAKAEPIPLGQVPTR